MLMADRTRFQEGIQYLGSTGSQDYEEAQRLGWSVASLNMQRTRAVQSDGNLRLELQRQFGPRRRYISEETMKRQETAAVQGVSPRQEGVLNQGTGSGGSGAPTARGRDVNIAEARLRMGLVKKAARTPANKGLPAGVWTSGDGEDGIQVSQPKVSGWTPSKDQRISRNDLDRRQSKQKRLEEDEAYARRLHQHFQQHADEDTPCRQSVMDLQESEDEQHFLVHAPAQIRPAVVGTGPSPGTARVNAIVGRVALEQMANDADASQEGAEQLALNDELVAAMSETSHPLHSSTLGMARATATNSMTEEQATKLLQGYVKRNTKRARTNQTTEEN